MLTGTFFYSFDTKTTPGKMVCRGVRFEILELPLEGFDETTMNILCDQHAELAPFDLKAFRYAVQQNFRL